MVVQQCHVSYTYITALNWFRAELGSLELEAVSKQRKELQAKALEKFRELEHRRNQEALENGLEALKQAIEAEYQMYFGHQHHLKHLKKEITVAVKTVLFQDIETVIQARLDVIVRELVVQFGEAIGCHTRPIVEVFQKELEQFICKVRAENACLHKALDDMRKHLKALQVVVEKLTAAEVKGRLSFTVGRDHH